MGHFSISFLIWNDAAENKIHLLWFSISPIIARHFTRLRSYFPWKCIWKFAGWQKITPWIVWFNITV